MSHTDLLYALALEMPRKELYIELGVQAGVTFERIAPLFNRAIGVDIADIAQMCARIGRESFVGRTQDFFKSSPPLDADFIFIDADHGREAVYADFQNALKLIRPFTGIIACHDTYPENEEYIVPEFSNDAWKAASRIHKESYGVESATLPFAHGITVCRLVPNNQHLEWMNTNYEQ